MQNYKGTNTTGEERNMFQIRSMIQIAGVFLMWSNTHL